jgi:predicted O-methyltransferase YrrM
MGTPEFAGMSRLDTAAPSARFTTPTLPFALRSVAALFAATLFVSALLLFTVQPMFAKMVLPRLGGAPSVWSVAMVAFQSFLFMGYVYAHVLARTLPMQRAAIVHLGFLALVATSLPLGIAGGFDVPPADGVMIWLVALFAASIGPPFVALSATAPLLQNWFAATGHPQARNPYVLYAASNLGSFCALLAYPFAVEPFLSLSEQRVVWSAGYAALAVGICAAAFVVARPANGSLAVAPAADPPPAVGERASAWFAWTLLMAAPAGLCIAMTAFITTDLAAAPFFWVLPLALYLLTFVAVFRERPWIPHAQVLRLLPYVVAPLAVTLLGGVKVFWLVNIILNLTAFVLIALACHGEAYRRRPGPARLTEFYLWTSFGGVVGGVFAGLVAPHVFANTYEYPILISVALLALPGIFTGGARHVVREVAPPLMAAAVVIALALFDVRLVASELALQILLVIIAALMLLQAQRPARFFGYAVMAFVITALWQPGVMPVETARSFFGVHRVVESPDATHRLLFNGTTIHGAEAVRDGSGRRVTARPVPLTYYYFGGPISEAVEAARSRQGRLDRVAVVGLGTGSMACHKSDGERWTFFEIDPEVVRLASDEKYFRFLSVCGPIERIVLGDARITLAASPKRYDLIVLDAFSSDAIPLHLLTREAFAGYLTRLAPNGVIAIHVSNRHMELSSVVAAVGAAGGLVAYGKQDSQANDFLKDYRANAKVVVLAKSVADVGDLPSRRGWTRLAPVPGIAAWTDDYSDVLRAILRKKLGD